MTPLSWTPGGPIDRLTWKAAVRQGTYEIDHATLAARFVRAAPATGAEPIIHPYLNLEATQRFCEQHWEIVVCNRRSSSNSSRRRAVGIRPPR
jgi:hypothetical protein